MNQLRRLVVSPVLALALAIALTAGVNAASTSLTILGGSCTTTGGPYGHGRIELSVKATEQGLSNARRIVFIASLMHQSRSQGGSWTLNQTQQHIAHLTANTAAAQSRTWKAVWNLGGDVATYRHRIEVDVWFETANGSVLATNHVSGGAC